MSICQNLRRYSSRKPWGERFAGKSPKAPGEKSKGSWSLFCFGFRCECQLDTELPKANQRDYNSRLANLASVWLRDN